MPICAVYNAAMKLKFTKMHGAGNDFVVIDAIHQPIELSAAQCRQLADRRFGIGADQILVVEKPDRADVDFRYRIYNADGGEVEQCGNGARAFARFVAEQGLSDKRTIRVATLGGIIAPTLEEHGLVTVDMGRPQLDSAQVPFDSNGLQARVEQQATLWPLDINGEQIWISALSMGNPHAVQIVADIEAAPVAVSGPLIEHYPRFAQRVNAGFMQIIDRQHIRLRVYERGAGETLACGTGACAAVVAGVLRGRLDAAVEVSTRGGTLRIGWDGPDHAVRLTGPACTVFHGEIEL
jgi:diaminopimelate epimerase